MTKFVQDADFILHLGDALEVLRELPSESVHMCVTSPPFFGLRDYGTGTWEGGDEGCDHVQSKPQTRRPERDGGWRNGVWMEGAWTENQASLPARQYRVECGKCGARRVDRQIGLEASPDEWVARLVDVFREVRRVLRSDGTLWLEIGDSYASSSTYNTTNTLHTENGWKQDAERRPNIRAGAGLKPKDLVGAPWLLAFALRADGWFLRSDIIWARPNPMPESVRDRPTKSHSYVFLLSKSPRYFFDQEAVREPPTDNPGGAAFYARKGQPMPARPRPDPDRKDGGQPSQDHVPNYAAGRNIRSVWTIPTEPLPDEHYAAYPQKLVERCILAGTSERGCCPECGAPWERVVERTPMQIPERVQAPRVGSEATSLVNDGERRRAMNGQEWAKSAKTETLGWRPSCNCTWPGAVVPREPIPCMVLDPFLGSGTTALVARRLGRHTIGIELSPTYAAMAARRLQQLSLLA